MKYNQGETWEQKTGSQKETRKKTQQHLAKKLSKLVKRDGKTQYELHKGGKTNKRQVELIGQSKKGRRTTEAGNGK